MGGRLRATRRHWRKQTWSFRWKKRPRLRQVRSQRHGITLLMSRLDNAEKPAHPLNDHQISLFHELRRLYSGIPASLANSSGIFFAPKAHFDLVRAGAALYGVNPTPGADNPMLPVIELRARIVQVLSLAPGETIAGTVGWAAKRPTRLALVSVGYADGYPRSGSAFDNKLQAIVGGQRCPVVGTSFDGSSSDRCN